jgi:hypothetical protein
MRNAYEDGWRPKRPPSAGRWRMPDKSRDPTLVRDAWRYVRGSTFPEGRQDELQVLAGYSWSALVWSAWKVRYIPSDGAAVAAWVRKIRRGAEAARERDAEARRLARDRRKAEIAKQPVDPAELSEERRRARLQQLDAIMAERSRSRKPSTYRRGRSPGSYDPR